MITIKMFVIKTIQWVTHMLIVNIFINSDSAFWDQQTSWTSLQRQHHRLLLRVLEYYLDEDATVPLKKWSNILYVAYTIVCTHQEFGISSKCVFIKKAYYTVLLHPHWELILVSSDKQQMNCLFFIFKIQIIRISSHQHAWKRGVGDVQ